MRTVLMIAFHYPPFAGGSGIHRTVAFSRYLPERGWSPVVLSAAPGAYHQRGGEEDVRVPVGVAVERPFALDAARHLAIRGHYPRWLAMPDRWASWWLGAVPAGLRIVRELKPDVLWSTYPIATAHLIALTLHAMTGTPWVADFRDSMTEAAYPEDPTRRKLWRSIERRTVARCDRAIFTAPGALEMYAARYPGVPRERWGLIENGYDEESYRAAERDARSASRPGGRPLTLVHSGLLYESERNPIPFFDALAELRRRGQISPSDLRVVLRGSGNEAQYAKALDARGLTDVVRLEGPLPYGAALAEMISADGLLVFQASNCNHQIPAKVYEYLRARKPILGLTDLRGDTASLLRASGIDTLEPLDSRDRIEVGFLDFVRRIRSRSAPVPTDATAAGHSRERRTDELVEALNAAASRRVP